MANDKPKALLYEIPGKFYASRVAGGQWAVFMDGGEKRFSDGSRSFGLCWPVMICSEYVKRGTEEELCREIAEALNESDKFEL